MLDSDASLFGLARPAFAFIDHLLSGFLAPLPRVVAWGCLMAALTMLLYRLISPQGRLVELRTQAASARQRLAAFDGELDQLLPLVRQSLALSMRQIGTIFVPAFVASLPLVACLVFLDSKYGYRTPAPGEAVRVTVSPPSEPLRSSPQEALAQAQGQWVLRWPPAGETVELLDARRATIVQAGGRPASGVIERRLWWNALVGNPMGYLPQETPIDRIEFEFAGIELLRKGPGWIRGWPFAFFLSLVIVSIFIKVVFRIE